MRITYTTLLSIVRYINTLESHVNPKDTAQWVCGEIWSIDYIANEGVYIRRGHFNPTDFDNRISVRDAYQFLTGVQYALTSVYHTLNNTTIR